MAKVEVLEAAQVEFRNARHWYRNRSAEAARRFALEVKAAIIAIRENPEMFASWDETYRFTIVNRFPYFIAYRSTHEAIVIVAIRHTSQDQGAWMGR